MAAVALLFFLHGAKLSRNAIVAGLSHWRLHLVVVGTTFVLFPLLGWALRPVLLPLVTPGLYTGILYLGVLPATVQSAIAFTAMARGNMPAAICSASASTLLGIVITPLLVGLLLPEAQQQAGAAQHDTLANIGRITLQLLVPFVAATCCVRGLAVLCSAVRQRSSWWTRAPSCWWCSPPSALRWSRGCGGSCPRLRCWAWWWCAPCC